jgi:hypothetical protein
VVSGVARYMSVHSLLCRPSFMQGVEVYHDKNKIDFYGALATESNLLRVRRRNGRTHSNEALSISRRRIHQF